MARTIGKAGFKMKGMNFGNSPAKQVDLTKKKGKGPRAKVKKTDFEKMSYAEQERYMNEEHHSIVPTFSDHIDDAMRKKKK